MSIKSKVEYIVKTLKDKRDIEIAILFFCWLSNGNRCDWMSFLYVFEHLMRKKPRSYIVNGKFMQDTFCCGVLSDEMFHNICSIAKDVYEEYDDLEDCIRKSTSKKSNYFHSVFASIFHDCGFCSQENYGAHYRTYLIPFLLNKILHVWEDFDNMKVLLPANDATFANAHKVGITNEIWKSNMKYAKLLTKIEEEKYGHEAIEFHKMLINYDSDGIII